MVNWYLELKRSNFAKIYSDIQKWERNPNKLETKLNTNINRNHKNRNKNRNIARNLE